MFELMNFHVGIFIQKTNVQYILIVRENWFLFIKLLEKVAAVVEADFPNEMKCLYRSLVYK